MSRLPIFHDDRSFREQTERMFREMEESIGFHRPYNPAGNSSSLQDFMTGTGAPRWPPVGFDDNQFFQLRPSIAHTHQDVTPGLGTGLGLQSEVLDDATTRSLFVDLDPTQKGQGGQGRKFCMSFDVRQYDPVEMAVRCEDWCLVVEAKHLEHNNSASKVTREFQRRIQLPPDVDPTKLTSTLSTDGILTVEAPVPPRYQAIVGPPQNGSSMLRTPAIHAARASPVTVRLDASSGTVGRSRSPFLDGTSPFSTGAIYPGNGSVGTGFMPIPTVGPGLRNSPVPFTTLPPTLTSNTSVLPAGQTVDFPLITTDPATGLRQMELILELGRPYIAEDVVVRVDGRRLTIDARHETRDPQHGGTSTSTTQKQFEIDGELDANTVTAALREDGRMVITGSMRQ